MLDDRCLLASFTLSRFPRLGGRQRHRQLAGHRDEDLFFVLAKGRRGRARGGDDAQRALVGDQRGDHQCARIELVFDIEALAGRIGSHVVDAHEAALAKRAADEALAGLEHEGQDGAIEVGPSHELQEPIRVRQRDAAPHGVAGGIAEQAGYSIHRRRERLVDALASRHGLRQVGERFGLTAGSAFAAHRLEDRADRAPAEQHADGEARATNDQPPHEHANDGVLDQRDQPHVDERKRGHEQDHGEPGNRLQARDQRALILRQVGVGMGLTPATHGDQSRIDQSVPVGECRHD